MTEMCNLSKFDARETLTVYAADNNIKPKEIIKDGKWVSNIPIVSDQLSKNLFDVFVSQYKAKERITHFKEGFIDGIEIIQNIIPTMLLILLLVVMIILLYATPVWVPISSFVSSLPHFHIR
jgi:hypothetical protein